LRSCTGRPPSESDHEKDNKQPDQSQHAGTPIPEPKKKASIKTYSLARQWHDPWREKRGLDGTPDLRPGTD
jgi:hypothetical protein